MKNKILLILICTMCLFCLTGCGNSEKGYQNIAFENLKTYTEVTKINANESLEEVGKMKYTYQVNNKDDQNIAKYKDYLTNEYGFTFNSDKSSDDVELYDYKGNSIIFETEKHDNNVFLVINIPVSEEYLPKNIEKKYNEALENINNEDYREARNILWSIRNTENYFEYKEAQKAIAYANGMLYKKSNIYGSAIKSFTNASGYKDADSLKAELQKLVSKYEGSWYYDNPKFPGKGLGYYMFIKDGMVSLNFESSYSDGVPASYSYSLAMKHNDENSLDEMFIVSSLAGLDNDVKKDDYEYLLFELPDGGLVLSERDTLSKKYYGGIYDKTSNETPNFNEYY